MLRFSQLKDFTDAVERSGRPLPFKVMGVRQPNEYFTLSMLKAVYEDIDDPDRVAPLNFPIPTLFGEIKRKGATLDPATTYSALTAPAKGPNLFQGDLIELDLNGFISQSHPLPTHQYSMILSHSCDIENSPKTVLAPIYQEQELSRPVLEHLKGSTVKNDAITRINWLRNESPKYAGFPENPNPSQISERFLVPLAFTVSAPRDQVIARAPILRLTYRSLSYLQIRLAMILIRDVQSSDETRDF